MGTKLQQNPCHWILPQLLGRMETKHVVLDVLARSLFVYFYHLVFVYFYYLISIPYAFYRSLLRKKWWQPLDIITGIVSDVAFVVNHWILHLFVMVLMTRFTVGCVMDVLGNKPLSGIFYFRVAGGNTNIYMFVHYN